jgi:hypothetical protein
VAPSCPRDGLAKLGSRYDSVIIFVKIEYHAVAMSTDTEERSPSEVVKRLLAALEWRATKLQVNEDELAEMGIFEPRSWAFGPSREEWREIEDAVNAPHVRRSIEEKRSRAWLYCFQTRFCPPAANRRGLAQW